MFRKKDTRRCTLDICKDPLIFGIICFTLFIMSIAFISFMTNESGQIINMRVANINYQKIGNMYVPDLWFQVNRNFGCNIILPTRNFRGLTSYEQELYNINDWLLLWRYSYDGTCELLSLDPLIITIIILAMIVSQVVIHKLIHMYINYVNRKRDKFNLLHSKD